MRHALLGAVLALAACAPPPVTASLPPGAIDGAGDPTRTAINTSSYIFANPQDYAAQPAAVARAVANLEFLAATLPTNPVYTNFSPNLGGLLAAGRDETRGAFAISPTSTPQPVIDGLYGAARALDAGNRAAAENALSPAVFTAGGAATLARLAQAPNLPAARLATARAAEELNFQRPSPARL